MIIPRSINKTKRQTKAKCTSFKSRMEGTSKSERGLASSREKMKKRETKFSI